MFLIYLVLYTLPSLLEVLHYVFINLLHLVYIEFTRRVLYNRPKFYRVVYRRVVPIIGKKGGRLYRGTSYIVIGELSYREKVVPVAHLIVDEYI